MTIILIISLLANVLLAITIRAMSINHLGTFSPVVTRLYLCILSLLRVKCSVIAYDIRKMHELNAVMGYDNANILIARLTKIRRFRGDFLGQYGGDEFVIISSSGSAGTIAARLVRQAQEITRSMTTSQRTELDKRTNGITDGLKIAMAYRNVTTNAQDAARVLVDETEVLKEHGATMTGNRATTGNAGTLVCGK